MIYGSEDCSESNCSILLLPSARGYRLRELVLLLGRQCPGFDKDTNRFDRRYKNGPLSMSHADNDRTIKSSRLDYPSMITETFDVRVRRLCSPWFSRRRRFSGVFTDYDFC